MDYKAVKKEWNSWVSKNLDSLQGNFRNKNFLDLLGRSQWSFFDLKKTGSI